MTVLKTEKEASSLNLCLFKCMGCSYERNICSEEKVQKRLVVHPVYGKHTLKEIALIEIRAHDCAYYNIRLAALKRQWRYVTEYGTDGP